MKTLLAATLALFPPVCAAASDACAPTAIITEADVTVSDGKTYRTRSMFHTRDTASIEFIENGAANRMTVEGPLAWTASDDGAAMAGDDTKAFALGHQFHALMLRFEEIVDKPRPIETGDRHGVMGDIPGGTAYLFHDETGAAAAMRFVFPERPVIDITFQDWQKNNGVRIPYLIRIDDDGRIFDYRYSKIALKDRSPLWFYEDLPSPGLDAVDLHRLHRKLLAAHCLGDATMMASLTAPDIIVANRGALIHSSAAETGERFAQLFDQIDYTAYIDIAEPVIDVADSGDIGWIAVNVRAVGKAKESKETFDDQWAWVLLARKIDGAWLNAGNASNVKAE